MALFSVNQAETYLHLPLTPGLEGKQLIEGVSLDTRRLQKGDLFVAVQGQKIDGHDLVLEAEQKGAVALLVEKPVNSRLPSLLVSDSKQALGRLAKAYRAQFNLPVLGLTGSVGKTTVKALITALLKQRYRVVESEGNQNNEWGLPLTLFRLQSDTEVAVLEMGACRKGDIAYLADIAQPTMGLITCIGTAHIDSFGSQANIASGKTELFRAIPASGTLIVNLDDPFLQIYQKNQDIKATNRIGVSLAQHPLAEWQVRHVVLGQDKSTFNLCYQDKTKTLTLPLPGEHNIQNALLAAAVAYALNVSFEAIIEGLSTFMPPDSGRLSIKRPNEQTIVIDDSYNASPDAMRAAIQVLASYKGKRFLVMGDMLELGEASPTLHEEMGRLAKAKGIQTLFGLGSFSQYATAAFGLGASHFTDKSALIAALVSLLEKETGSRVILVKGSRGMQMEEVVKALC